MGSRLVYYLLILPISILPFFLLYGLSNVIFFLLFSVFGYRKKVVLGNIQRSFPTKSPKEHTKIMALFYRHFCDIIIESIKGFTVSRKQLRKRITFPNAEVLRSFFNQGKDVVLVGSHYNNWEITATASGLCLDHLPVGIYKPLSNVFFDRKMKTSRERYGIRMISMKETPQMMRQDFGKPKAVIFAVDQSPSNPKKCYWTEFLNQDTPVFYGPEKFAQELNLPIFFIHVQRVKEGRGHRGYYEVTFELITDKPKEIPYGKITETHVNLLETDIIAAPQYWLWTHKRWKHKKPMEINAD